MPVYPPQTFASSVVSINVVINPWYTDGQSPWTFQGDGAGNSSINPVGFYNTASGVCPGNPSNMEADVFWGNEVIQHINNVPVNNITGATVQAARCNVLSGTMTIQVRVVYSDTTSTLFTSGLITNWVSENFLSSLTAGKLIASIDLVCNDSASNTPAAFDNLQLTANVTVTSTGLIYPPQS